MSDTLQKTELVEIKTEQPFTKDLKVPMKNEKGATELNTNTKLEDNIVLHDEGKAKETKKNIVVNKSTWVFMQQGAPQYQPPQEEYQYFLVYNPEYRNYFIRLVFFLVFLMLVYTAGMTMLFRYIKVLHKFLFSLIGIVLIVSSVVIVFAMHYVMFCSPCSRKSPCSYICLFVTATSMGFITSFVTFRYRTQILLIVIVVTALVVLVCLVLACTKFDFTKFILFVIIAGVVIGLLSLGFMVAKFVFGVYFKPLHIALIFASTLLSCVGLIIELQMIIGGKTLELGQDDYALGAFMLYLSIIEIFFKLLALTGLISDH